MSTFGAQLKQEREKQGVSLEDISLTTKIGTRMLRALEDEHFDQLPGGIFNKGFIRAYARCLGMDEEQAIADYLVATGASPAARKPESDQASDLSPVIEPPPREPGTSPGLPWGTLAIVLLIVALGFAGWGFYSRESEKAQDSVPLPVNSPSAQPAAVAEQPPPEPKPTEPASSASKPVEDKIAAPTATPSTAPAAVSAPASTPTADQPQPSMPANGTFLVLIRAHEDSWLSISVDGEIVTRSLLTAPAQKSVRAHDEMIVRAGNVGALDFEFNGIKLPSQGEHGEAKTLTFDSHGLRTSAAKPETPPTPATNPEKP